MGSDDKIVEYPVSGYNRLAVNFIPVDRVSGMDRE
jgi:hypothetical protein